MPKILYSLPVVVATLLSFATAILADKPNIVVIYSDDAGYADFGFQPNVAQDMQKLTPFIDSIARNGVRCSNAYMAGCVCSPSRAALMTGRYQSRFGFDNNLPAGTQNGLSLDETFGSKRLQQLGYTTALIGKWHLGYPPEFHPNNRGWDWFYGCLQGSRSYYPIKDPSPHRVLLDDSAPTPEEGYVTDRLGDAACRFIAKHQDDPFYLFVSFTSPHGPLQPKKTDLDRVAHINNDKRKKYAGLVVSLDDNVGKILRALAKHQLDKKTFVIFTNDNGGQTSTGANNRPLRGRKGDLYEGGIRVPWAMRWPGKVKPGSVIEEPVIAIDLLPTFIAVAGGKVDSDWNLDGVNLFPLLTGEKKSLDPRILYWRKGGSMGTYAIRESKWKMVVDKSSGNKPELFDLSEDVSESKDLASNRPEVIKRLSAKLDEWSKGLTEPIWGTKQKRTKRSDK